MVTRSGQPTNSTHHVKVPFFSQPSTDLYIKRIYLPKPAIESFRVWSQFADTRHMVESHGYSTWFPHARGTEKKAFRLQIAHWLWVVETRRWLDIGQAKHVCHLYWKKHRFLFEQTASHHLPGYNVILLSSLRVYHNPLQLQAWEIPVKRAFDNDTLPQLIGTGSLQNNGV